MYLARQRFTARSYQTFRDFLMSFHTVPRAFVTSWLRFYILIFHPQRFREFSVRCGPGPSNLGVALAGDWGLYP